MNINVRSTSTQHVSESWAVKKCDENGSQRVNCGPGDVCCVSAGLNMRQFWVRQKIGVTEDQGLLEQLKKTEVGQICALEGKK